MGAHTMNAGKIYFPGGTPDPNDIDGGKVDLEASVRREVEEETGLAPSEFEIDRGWHCIPAGPMIALLKPMRSRETAARLRQRILDHIERESGPGTRRRGRDRAWRGRHPPDDAGLHPDVSAFVKLSGHSLFERPCQIPVRRRELEP